MRTTTMRLALATGVVLTSPLSSWAQSSPAQGNPIDTLPRVDTSRPPEQKIHVEVQRPNSALENLLATHLTPGKFQIEGVKALPFPEIAAYFAPMAGHDVTVAQLLQAANDVTKLYADRGYPLSFAFVPAQTFEGGVVRITVVEGYVARMRVEGTPGPLEGRLRAISKRMMDERPLRRETFERVTGVLALQPGVQITATVQPPTTTDGASELVLDVKRQPYTIGTGVEYRSPGVRAVVTGTLNSLTPLGEQISVSTLQPRGRDDETYYSATWAQPIGTDGLLAKLTWSHYRGRPENLPLEQLGYQSRYLTDAQRLGLSLSYPVLLSNTRSLTLTGTAYANEDMQRYTPQNQAIAPVDLSSKVRVVGTEALYTEVRPGETRRASLGIYQGIDGVGASKSLNNNIDLGFLRTRITASEAHDLPFGFGMAISGAAQYSGAVLPSSEQISFGGRFFGLAYPAGEVAGDRGWGMSFEINRLFQASMTYLKTVQPYVLFDTAKVYSNAATLVHDQLGSIALGVRFSDRKYYTLDLALARPVGDRPTNANARSLRFNAAYTYQFP
ncbi:ShlB/FhaC/HecB family hemolysin secretion/activation protein [Ralstonia solanacearum]|uniref:ShlB/FhaC/HecB family hemolysin secretion/activation protein n=1 Tax=Ralstonia solanacearum TaxID=305 RepID=UPI0001817188|nr:ShlB/FhaC/HecB family hemolysin secretion/activation protein [Ralstonia solanacearum]MDC6178731.1 ShlB/FhaC/HecB family hemolysin secretion/activation protein [Ralstonia solanacearum]MDC6211359.1 ShlB/FhaC/HecB family hemolysin secretion/activation protein [Ralstonia solanacearum]MDC6240196.1 ShlB/FhaC/HecB family hemolysin secretion/activation protein [Ralstonia solanacearum]MDD7801881.1 ShlB/FhaC/HecB family hemolysin secretion/activation protein [Ralstonia solanacearum]TYZ55284.1 ShlB/Fh